MKNKLRAVVGLAVGLGVAAAVLGSQYGIFTVAAERDGSSSRWQPAIKAASRPARPDIEWTVMPQSITSNNVSSWPFDVAATRTVTKTADTNDGVCDGDCSLREAVAVAIGGDTVVFAGGVTGTISLSSGFGEILVNKLLTITGPGANSLTVSGGNLIRIFRVGGAGNLTVSGLTLANGKGGDVGGAIVSDGTLTMNNCAVVNSSAGSGWGGGGVYQAGGIGFFRDCTFSGNTAAVGGGLHVINSTSTILGSTISGNTATASGGAVKFETIGGGASKSLTVTSSTIAGNNSAGTGGILVQAAAGISALLNIRNTIVSANQNANLAKNGASATILSAGYNLANSYNGAVTTASTDITADALIGPLTNNGGPTQTRALLGGSPALDKGINSGSGVTTDQRGQPRTVDLAISNAAGGDATDIGAFEAASIPACGLAATPIAFGQTLNGTLAAGDCHFTRVGGATAGNDGTLYDAYTFSGTSGQQVAIAMTSPAGPANFDTIVRLYQGSFPGGTFVTENDDIDGGNNRNSRIPVTGFFTLATTGTYTIIANAYSAAAGGDYTLNLTLNETTPPTATATAPDVSTAGGTSHTAFVTYVDNVSINVATLDTADVRITGPNGFNAVPTSVVAPPSNGTPRAGNYAFTPPGGTWDAADNGTYNIVMQANQVADTSGNFVATGPPIGTFTVSIPTPVVSVNGTGGDDTFTVTATGANSGSYSLNGGPPVPMAGVTQLTLNGLGGNDTFTINNQAGGLFAPSGGIDINGGGQPGDNLNLLGGGGPGFNETYFVGTTTPPIGGGAGNNGNGLVRFTGANPVDIRFTGLAPIVDTVAAASLTVNATDAANTISVTNASVSPRLRIAVDAFEPIDLNNKTAVTINGGDGIAGGDAADTITVNYTNAPAALTTLVVRGDEGNDVITVLARSGSHGVTLNGGGNDDQLNAAATVAGAGTINLIGGDGNDALVGGGGNDSFDGGAGNDTFIGNGGTDNVGGGGGVSVDDRILVPGTAAGDTITLAIDGSGFLLVTINSVTTTYRNFIAGPFATAGIDGIVVNAEAGNDVVTVLTNIGQQAITLNGGNNDDQLNAAATVAGSGAVTINGGDGNDALVGGGGNDVYDGGAGNDTFIGNGGTDNIGAGAGVSVDDRILVPGTAAGDTINLAIDGSGFLIVTINSVTTTYRNFLAGPFATAGIEGIVVNADAGNDVVTVLTNIGQQAITLNGGNNDDQLNAAATVAGSGAVTINGGDGNDALVGGGGNDVYDGGAGNDTFIGNGGTDNIGAGAGVSVDDRILMPGTGANDTFTLAVDGSGFLLATINGVTTTYRNFISGSFVSAGVEAIDITGVAGNDTFNVEPLASTAINIDGGSPVLPTLPGDTLSVNLAGTTGQSFTPGVAGAGVVTFTNRSPLTYTSIETSPFIAPPTISIEDVSREEGNGGLTPFGFNINLSAASAQTITVTIATANGTATAPSDYTTPIIGNTFTFNPGEMTKTATIQINGDTSVEPNETFFVNLSNPTNATIADGQGQGTIINDDFAPATFVVTNLNDSGAGSLRQAILSANANSPAADTINFQAGLTGTITLTSGELAITDSVTINGPGLSVITVSGGNASRVFRFGVGTTSTLSGVTVTNGNGVGGAFNNSGGGIFNDGVLTVANSAVTGNSAGQFGGGLYSRNGSLTVTNSIISGNNAGIAGGIVTVFATLSVTGSTISGNTAGDSGGIDCTGTTVISGTTISGNTGKNGAAITSFGSLNLTNSTISGNNAPSGDNNSGGIWTGIDSSTTITNSTITNNSAAGANSAGGLYRSTGGVTLRNSIVAANQNNTSQPDVVAVGNTGITSNGFNLIGNRGSLTFNGTSDQSGTGASPLNPLLGPLANNGGSTRTHALLAGSPAIDKGSNSGSGVTTDQRGSTRVVDLATVTNASGGDGTDIGAYEAQTDPNSAPTITPLPVAVRQGSPTSTTSIATVGDVETPAGALSVSVNGGTSATVNGVTVSNLVNTNGTIAANIVASCTAGPATAVFTIRVLDSWARSAEATLSITVQPNLAPTLSYTAQNVGSGGSLNVSPATGPSDLGGLQPVVLVSQGTYTGTISVNTTTGVVSVSNAQPAGTHTIIVRATDNCATFTDVFFQLTVSAAGSAVVTNTNDSGPGSLRQAVAGVADGGTITFSSLFSVSEQINEPGAVQTITLTSGEIVINKSLTISGPGADKVAVSGNNVSRVFSIAGGNTVTISGLTVTGGNGVGAAANGVGGGILSLSNLTMTNVHVVANQAVTLNGGGIAVAFVDALFTSCTISGNTAATGGGIYFQGDGGNTLRVVSSTVSGNSSGGGSGIENRSNGGNSRLEVTNSTIAANSGNSGGIVTFTDGVSTNTATTTLRNTIVAGNTPADLAVIQANSGGTGTFTSQGYNLASDNGGGFLTGTADQINTNPLLGPLQNNGGPMPTHSLLPGSPAIDGGNSSGSINDQRGPGFLRVVDLLAPNAAGGDGADIGAFEVQTEPPPATASISGTVVTPSGLVLRSAVVTLTDSQGVRRTATTGTFGTYLFDNVATGQSYFLTISSKRYRFAPRSETVNGNLVVNFVGLE